MKILIAGLGAIGQRHVRRIRKLCVGEVEIAAYRLRNLDMVVSDSLEGQFGLNPAAELGLQTFADLGDALRWGPHAVFITNPISLHVPVAIEAAKSGCHLFIEKPLGSSIDGIQELKNITESKKLICAVGYQLRFHPALTQIKKLLAKGALGRLYHAQLSFGEWLPGMHPYEDYRISHAARSDQGGGAILCLSHDIDYAVWLFGRPNRLIASGGRVSDLDMDVEDSADILLVCKDQGREFQVNIHLDFLNRKPERTCRVLGENGVIQWDYFAGRTELWDSASGTSTLYDYTDFHRADMFDAEISDFLRCVRTGATPVVDLNAGIQTLEVCLAAKESILTGGVSKLL